MKNLLFLFVVLASFASCKKEDSANQLPEPSSSGKNFLACKVNGMVHKYSGLWEYMDPNGVTYKRGVDKLLISSVEAKYGDGISMYLLMPSDSVDTDTKYIFGGESSKSYSTYDHDQSGPPLEFSTTAGSGWVRFSRVDTAVAAGTFAFTAYLDGQQGKDSIVITEGVFDISR